MRYTQKAKYALIAFFVILIEMLISKYIQIGGAIPMLCFCFCIIVSVFEKKEEDIIFCAVFSGAVLDILSMHGFGTYTVTFLASCLAASYFAEKIFSSMLLYLIVSILFLTIFVQSAYYLLNINNIANSFFGMMLSKILPTALYNIVIVALAYPAVIKIYKKRR